MDELGGSTVEAQLRHGGEFNREFGDVLEAMGVEHFYSGVQAPWQNGRCERQGGGVPAQTEGSESRGAPQALSAQP